MMAIQHKIPGSRYLKPRLNHREKSINSVRTSMDLHCKDDLTCSIFLRDRSYYLNSGLIIINT